MAHFVHSLQLHLHPMVVHFPIALFISALGLEILSLILRKENLHQTALHLYLMAAVLSPLVVLTGLREEDRLQFHHPVLEIHERFALLTMWGSLASLPILGLVKRKVPSRFRLIFVLFALLMVTIISITAYNGGRLVYEYGAGVEEP